MRKSITVHTIIVFMTISSFCASAQDHYPPQRSPFGRPEGMPFREGFGEPQKPKVGGKDIDSDEYIDAREEKFFKSR